MSNTYEQLNRQKLQEEQKLAKEESINITDKRLYQEMTKDTGDHDEMLNKLDQQFSILGEIRKTGRPAHLEAAQKEELRYQHIGHFDKKDRISAAKEAQKLTIEAKGLNQMIKDLPADAMTISYDLKMTELMRQAEMESLKANVFSAGSPEFDRMNLKYLRHSEIIMENTLQNKDGMSEEQYKAVSDSLQNVQSKIDEVLEHDNVRDLQEFNFIEAAAREVNKPPLDPEEGEKVLRRTARVTECVPVDLHRLSVFSPKLLRVDDAQVSEFVKEYAKKEKEKEQAKEEKQEKDKKRSGGKSFDAKKYADTHSLLILEEKKNEYTDKIDRMLEYLNKNKERLGAPDCYKDKSPTLVHDTRKLFGLPRGVALEWFRTHSQKNRQKKKSK